MIFLDRSGHTFELPSWAYEPIGHEFEENQYTFWIDSKKLDKLSVNNYYCRPIYFIVPYNDTTSSLDSSVDISISIDSNKFWLVSTVDIQDIVNQGQSVNEYFDYGIDESSQKKTLDNDDLVVVSFKLGDEFENAKIHDGQDSLARNPWPKSNLALVTFYVLCNSDVEGTWLTNILIHVSPKNDNGIVDEDWCSITVGGEFVEQNEILYVNGVNMGIELPKDMFRAIWQCSFVNNEFNESIYNQKLKEYLMNYMGIHGEIGNYDSAIKSIKWFGYGDKLMMVKLLQTDNNVKTQFIRDYFDINTDILESFKTFKNSTYVSLIMQANQLTGGSYKQDLDKQFWGEGTPKLESLFDKTVEVEYDYDNEKFKYIAPWYDFSFYELGLKLACLKHYFKKYFLPIHLSVHSASIEHRVFMNDLKMITMASGSMIAEQPVGLENYGQVKFVNVHQLEFNHQVHYVDDKLNEFSDSSSNIIGQSSYYINDTCLNVPIRFVDKVDADGNRQDTYFNCVLLLEKKNDLYDSTLPYRIKFNTKVNLSSNKLVIYRHTTREIIDLDTLQLAYSEDNVKWSGFTKGYDNLLSKLEKSYIYKAYTSAYQDDEHAALSLTSDRFETKYSIDLTKLVIDESNGKSTTLANIIGKDIISINDKEQEISVDGWWVYIPTRSEVQTNPIVPSDAYVEIICMPSVWLMAKFDESEVFDVRIDGKTIKNKCKITLLNDTKLLYESHFSFVQTESHQYNSFVLYHKLIGNHELSQLVNKELVLRLLVNGIWYKYEFTPKMPDIALQCGTLEYKYRQNEFDDKFAQLSMLSDTAIKFNSYMYEPRLVEMNDINYVKNISEYILKNNIITVDDELISACNAKYIVYGDQNLKILFPNSLLENGNTITLKSSDILFAYKIGKFNTSIFILNDTLKFVKNMLCSIVDNKLSIWQRVYDSRQIETYHQQTEYIKVAEEESEDMIEDIVFVCEDGKLVYDGVEYEVFDGYFFNNNQNRYLSKFEESKDIMYNDKFLNHIILYDIYEPITVVKNIYGNYEIIKIACNGVTFDNTSVKMNNTIQVNVSDDEVIDAPSAVETIIYGTPLWDDDIYSNDVDLYSEYTNYDITQKSQEFIQNKFNDSTIQSEVSEAYRLSNRDADNGITERVSYYYEYSDFTGKKYFALSEVTPSQFDSTNHLPDKSQTNIWEFIDNTFGPWFSNKKRGIDNVKVCTIYYDLFNNMTTITDDETQEKMVQRYVDIDWCEDNNYSAATTKVWKSKDNEGNTKFNLKYQKLNSINVKLFDDDNSRYVIYAKVGYYRKDNSGNFYEVDQNSLSVKEMMMVFEGQVCDNLYIGLTLYLCAYGKEFFTDYSYSSNHQFKSNDIKDISDLEGTENDDIYQLYKDNATIKHYTIIDNQYIVLLYDTVEPLYINFHNDEIVYDDQPGLYIYDLSSLTEKDVQAKLDVIKTNEIDDKDKEYHKDIINLESYDDVDGLSNAIKSLYVTDDYSGNTVMKDYSYTKDNVYVVKRITDEVGDIHIRLGLVFYESDKDGYYTQDEMKQMTSLLVVVKTKSDGQVISIQEVKYGDVECIVTLDDSLELDILFKITITDESILDSEHKELKYRSANRIRIPKVGIFPILRKDIVEMSKLKYEGNRDKIVGESIDNNVVRYKYANTSSNLEPQIYEHSSDTGFNWNISKLSPVEDDTYGYVENDEYVVNLYNKFFKNSLMYIQDGKVEEVSDDVIKVEYVYSIEKQYDIWKQSHSLSHVDKSSQTLITHIDGYDDAYWMMDGKAYSELSSLEKQELANYARYQHSVECKSDFYDCKAYYDGVEVEFANNVFDKSYHKFITSLVGLDRFLDYDFYLMHDNDYWHGIFISKDTINKLDTKSKLKVNKEQKTLLTSGDSGEVNEWYYNYTGYELRYVNENVDFLINRMVFNKSNGINHFNQDDLIAMTIDTNNRIPTDIMQGSKWKVDPMSKNMLHAEIFDSNTEMTIIPYPNGQSYYDRGYYNVDIRYSLDGNNQNQYKKIAKIRIG